MDAKKCDRCGAFYVKYVNPVLEITKDEHPFPQTLIDLCPQCVEDLKKWLEMGKSDK